MKTKTARFIDGAGNIKAVHKKPKDWSFKKPSEGREGQKKRTRVRMKERGWTAADLNAHLAKIRAGLPGCTWTITSSDPARRLTATDYLYIRCHAFNNPQDVIVVNYNEDHRILNMELLTVIPDGKEEPKLGEGTLG